MTPNSTDRAHTISPLDIFGPAPHPSAIASQHSHAFEAVLNLVATPSKAALHGQPAQRLSAEQPAKEPDAKAEHTSEKTGGAARKKQSARASQANGRQREADDREPIDEPRENQRTCPPANDSSQSCPQPQEAQEVQDATAEAGTHVDPASKQDLGDRAGGAQPQVAIAEQLVDASVQVNVQGDEGILAANELALSLVEPGLSGEAALPPSELAATVHGKGSLSLAELGQDSAAEADPIVTIEGATATVEIQPAEPSGNGGEQNSGSGENDGRLQNVEDALSAATPSPDVLTSQETPSAAAASASTTVAPSSSKDAPPPQSGTSSLAAGVQQSPSRLPQHVLARSESHSHNPAPVPVDSTRFLSRVAKAFISAQQRDGEVRLRLSPPELGSLRLQVSVQDGVMVARMETETEAARSSLMNNLPALRERLAEQGIRVERFDIDLMQRPSTGTPDRPSDPQQQHDQVPLRLLRTQPAISEALAPAAQSNNWNGQGRLNVII